MKTLAADEPVATTDEPTDEQRVLDWGTETPVEVPGGDVVFVDTYTRTDDGHALRYDGDVPVATTSVYSERDLRAALSDAGYESDHIEIALANTLRGETGRRAARIAEGGDAQLATDGGTATETRTERRRDYSPCERCGDRSWFAKKSLTYPSRSHHAVEHVCGLCYALCHRQRWFTDPDGHSQKVPGAWDGDAPAVENHRAVALAARTEAGTGEIQPRETPAGRRVTGR